MVVIVFITLFSFQGVTGKDIIFKRTQGFSDTHKQVHAPSQGKIDCVKICSNTQKCQGVSYINDNCIQHFGFQRQAEGPDVIYQKYDQGKQVSRGGVL